MDMQSFANLAVEAAQKISASADGIEVNPIEVATSIGDYFNDNVVGDMHYYINLGYVYVSGLCVSGRNGLTGRSTVKQLRRWTARFAVSPEGDIVLSNTRWSEHFYRDIKMEWKPFDLTEEENELLVQMDKGDLVYDLDDIFEDDPVAGLAELQWFHDIAAQRLGTKPNIHHVVHVETILGDVEQGQEVRMAVGQSNFYLVFFQRLVNKEEYQICCVGRYGSQHVDYGHWLGD